MWLNYHCAKKSGTEITYITFERQNNFTYINVSNKLFSITLFLFFRKFIKNLHKNVDRPFNKEDWSIEIPTVREYTYKCGTN